MPILLGIALGVFQMWRLPMGVLHVLSPCSSELWQSVDSVDPHSSPRPDSLAFDLGVSGATGSSSISLYPASTRSEVSLLIIAASIFFLGVCLFASDKRPVMLFAALAILGTAMAFFGIAQQIAWNGKLYGFVELTGGGTPFGAFVTGKSGGFLNLCLAGPLDLPCGPIHTVPARSIQKPPLSTL